jgi:Kyakuja-Dileera-Zisupton transposase
MLDVFGEDLAAGYDIGCGFEITLDHSPLGEKAREKNHRCLVGAFHGHAHNRLCQSRFLATYVEGLGLEDLEGCERFFSKSNALAPGTRHASTFHRRQAIAEYARFTDKFETYANLSKSLHTLHGDSLTYFLHIIGTFLYNNYKQALSILETKPTVTAALTKLGASSAEVVKEWLREEETYLRGLSKEPLEETLEMEYYKMLESLRVTE